MSIVLAGSARRSGARRLVGLLLGVAVFALAWWQVRMFVADDTFIHLTYAKHLRDGEGLVFNLGERVYGTTSPLWSLALGALGWARLDLLLIARILSIVFGALTVMMVSRLLCDLLARMEEHRMVEPRIADLVWLMGTLAWAADAWMARWSASGMESSLGAFLVMAGFSAQIRAEGRHSRATAWLWAAAALIRPEATLLVGLLGLRAIFEAGSRVQRARRLGMVALPAIAIGGAWLAYAASFYGTVIPITFASKASEQTPLLHNLGVQASEIAATRGVEALALLAGVPFLLRRWRMAGPHLVALVWLIALPLFYAATHVLGITRYLLLMTPVLACYGWVSIAYLASVIAGRGAFRWGRGAVLAAGLLALAVNAYVMARWVAPQARAFDRIVHETLIPTAQWFHDFTPKETQIAIQHVGVFGYYAERNILDLSGLVTSNLTDLLAAYQYDRVITEFRFADRARPDYLIDVVNEPRRMLRQSPFAPCLDLLEEKPYDFRGLRTPEPGYLTVYRVDWSCVDAKRGG